MLVSMAIPSVEQINVVDLAGLEHATVARKSLDDCVLGFHLEPKATHGPALAVADFLNRNVVAITLA
jgi:hypothetical protein